MLVLPEHLWCYGEWDILILNTGSSLSLRRIPTRPAAILMVDGAAYSSRPLDEMPFGSLRSGRSILYLMGHLLL
eukprot:scaffold8183_cov122-Isochrysis_galbana.AAC.3